MHLKTTVAALALLCGVSPAYAQTLDQAMSAAVETNPSLAAQRARLRATREALPQAWAEALPQVQITASATRSDVYGDLLTTNPPRSETWTSAATASQLLFASGEVLASTRAARAQIRGAVADFDQTLEQLLLDVVSAYADVRQAQAVVAARQTSVSNLTTLAQYAQAQFDAGVVTRTDVAQAQARLAQARTQLVQAQGAMAAAVQAYLRLVGMPPQDLEAPPEAEGLPTDLDAALNTAGTTSPVLRSAVAATEQADAEVWVAQSQGLPRLSLQATSNLNGDFDLPSDDRSSGDALSLRFSWPLINGGAVASRTRQQRALRSAANLDLAQTQRVVQESVTNAWTGLASARAALESAREQERASELAYQGIRLEQETGLRSTIDVLNQEQDLLTSQLALAQAEHDLVVAERQILASMGTLSPPATGSVADLRGLSSPQNGAPAPASSTPPQHNATAPHHRRHRRR